MIYNCDTHYQPMTNLWRKRELIADFILLDLRGKYRSSYLGLFWSVLNPLAMLGLYTLVFHVIAKPSWDAPVPGGPGYTLTLFCGIIVFNFLGECLVRAPLLMASNRSYVKKVIFPIEILPVSIVGSALIHFAISLGVLLLAMLACGRAPAAAIVALPAILLPLVLLALGLSWAAALLGVYLRDTAYAMPFLVQGLFFLTPVVYPLSAVPARLRPLFQLNVAAIVVEQARGALLYGRAPDWGAWAAALLAAAAICALGHTVFMRGKSMLADAL